MGQIVERRAQSGVSQVAEHEYIRPQKHKKEEQPIPA
jgi:hypothetical protein